MKKVLFAALAVCLLAAQPIQAQLRFGIKGGANITSLSADKNAMINEIKNAANYQVGALVQIGFGNFAIQPELIFTTKGAELVNDGANDALNLYGNLTGKDVPNTFTLSTSYLELPINLQYGFKLGSLARVYVQAGPYASLLLADEMKGFESFYAEYKETVAEISDGSADFVNKLDFGVGVGAGIEVLFLQLAVKYDFSLTEFKEITSKIGNADLNIMSGMQNRNLSISLGILF